MRTVLRLYMPNRLFDPKVFLIPSLALIGLLAFMMVAYFMSDRAANDLAHSNNVKSLVRKAQISLLENKRYGRAYTQTGSDADRAQYEQALAEYEEIHGQLRSDIASNASQVARLRAVDSIASLHFAYSERVLPPDLSPEQSATLTLAHMKVTDEFMDDIREVFLAMVDEETVAFENNPITQRRWRYSIIGLILTAVTLLLRSLYILYRRTEPLFEELDAAREALSKSNINTLESLARYKKLSAERADDVAEKNLLLSQNQELVVELTAKSQTLDRITHAVANELNRDLKDFETQLTEFIDLHADNATLASVDLSMHLRNTLADMRKQVRELES